MINKKSNSNSPLVYVVEASAGSGKTYALAQHYINLLLNKESNPKEIENILAITFTKKAAAEMKERILTLLREIAMDETSPPPGIQIKARELLDYIIGNYNFFQIQTIDSFINKILVSCAYRFGISSNFEIRDDHSDFLRYSLDESIDKANRNKPVHKLFEDFLHHYIYLENGAGWMPKKNILDLMNSMYSHKNTYGKKFRKFDLRGENIYVSKRKLVGLYKSLQERLTDGIHGTFRKVLTNFVEKNTEIFDFDDIAGKATLTKDELPVKKGANIPPELDKLWKQIRKETVALSEKEALSFFNCYIDIFDFVYDIFRKYVNENDALFLEELNERAQALINENGVTVPELYIRLSTRIRHFLIDEFQDTSIIQWKNLFPMVEEILSTGGSFFYVGDKKQAIYRFRGGEAALFDEVKKSFDEYAKEEVLNVNYRSQKEIVEFNNAVFDGRNLRRFIEEQEKEGDDLRNFSEDDIEEIAGNFSNSKQENKKGEDNQYGYVKVELVECSDKDEKYEKIKVKILGLIEQFNARKHFDLKEIAILCRENEEVEAVSNWLLEKNIPVESEKTLNIKNNPRILEIISFLKFLNSPIDNLSFASFILGDIFLKATGTDKTDMQDFLFNLRGKISTEHEFYIYREFKNTYPGVWDNYIEKFFKNVGFIELYEFVTDIFGKFRVFENFPGQQGFFMHFIQLIKESEEEHNGISDFLEYLENLKNQSIFVNAKGTDAIKVMTIHKSKGLGFGIVLIPFLEFDRSSLRMNRTANVNITVENSGEILLVRLDKKYAQLSGHIASIYRKEYKKSFIDELNTIYVALTRAKNELYVFVPHGMAKGNNLAKNLIPENFFECGKQHNYRKEPKTGTIPLILSSPVYNEWIGFLKEEFTDPDSIKNRGKILKGKILHEILSSIENLVKEKPEGAVEKGIEKVKTLFPDISDFSGFRPIINRLLEKPELKKFFYVTDGEVYLEKNIVNRFGDTKRVDRLIVKENEVWIVEYKTRGESVLEYKEQITAYINLVKEIYPKKTTKVFIVFLEETRAEELNG